MKSKVISQGKPMTAQSSIWWQNVCLALCLLCSMFLSASAGATSTVDLSLREVDISAAMEMLSKREHVNIILADGVEGKISVNLYGVNVSDAIQVIANAAGFEAERRGSTFHVIKREDVNNYQSSSNLSLNTYKLRYAAAENIAAIIESYLSSFGTITVLNDRNIVIIEDTPEFQRRFARLIKQLDYRPQQILIEAKILEVKLDDSETFGVEWRKLLDSASAGGATGSFGSRSLSNRTAPGFFVNLSDNNIEAMLDALEKSGKARTLSTPSLLTVENESASVIVGNRLGYRNTVTANQVTTESTEFLESGVILEVTPIVDKDQQILLKIHPEVSTGTVTDGIPSQDTTSVDTQLIVPNGATSFIGGLMRMQSFEDHQGVPVLGRIPVVGKLFSRTEDRQIRTEIIVLIKPTIVNTASQQWQKKHSDRVNEASLELENNF